VGPDHDNHMKQDVLECEKVVHNLAEDNLLEADSLNDGLAP